MGPIQGEGRTQGTFFPVCSTILFHATKGRGFGTAEAARWELLTRQMTHGHVVSPTIAFPVVGTRGGIHVRMPVLFAPVYVRRTMVIEILASAFDAIVKTLPLYFAKFARRCIPASLILDVSGRLRWHRIR